MKPASAVEPAPGCPPALHYVSDDSPGYSRRILNDKPAYFDQQGKRIRDPETIRRINALAIPPAYRDVWICPDPRGHLQATGRDARGRKQYRYHPLWREVRDAAKYDRMLAFGNALSGVRRELDRRLRHPGLGRDRVIAAVILLLDETCIRDSGCLPGGGAGSGEMEHRSGQTPLAQARRGGPVKLSAALQPGRQTQGIRPGSSWRSSTSWYSPGGETALQLSM